MDARCGRSRRPAAARRTVRDYCMPAPSGRTAGMTSGPSRRGAAAP